MASREYLRQFAGNGDLHDTEGFPLDDDAFSSRRQEGPSLERITGTIKRRLRQRG